MNRIDRLMAMLLTLQSKKFATAEFIADKYQVSVRTVYRDLNALGEMGVPVSFENGKGYCIVKGFFLPPVSLTSEEANSLILLAGLSQHFGDKTTGKHIGNAIDKIKAVLRPHDKEKVDFLQSQVKVYSPPVEKNKPDFLTEIQNAIVNKWVLRIEYLNNSNEKSRRDIEPIGLTFYSNQWHLVAWCWLRKAYRDFKVREMTSLSHTGEKFRKNDHQDLSGYINTLG